MNDDLDKNFNKEKKMKNESFFDASVRNAQEKEKARIDSQIENERQKLEHKNYMRNRKSELRSLQMQERKMMLPGTRANVDQTKKEGFFSRAIQNIKQKQGMNKGRYSGSRKYSRNVVQGSPSTQGTSRTQQQSTSSQVDYGGEFITIKGILYQKVSNQPVKKIGSDKKKQHGENITI